MAATAKRASRKKTKTPARRSRVGRTRAPTKKAPVRRRRARAQTFSLTGVSDGSRLSAANEALVSSIQERPNMSDQELMGMLQEITAGRMPPATPPPPQPRPVVLPPRQIDWHPGPRFSREELRNLQRDLERSRRDSAAEAARTAGNPTSDDIVRAARARRQGRGRFRSLGGD